MSSHDLKRETNVLHAAHSHLVRGLLPLLRALPGLPDQRSLRPAAGNSGYCCSAVAADSPCRTASGWRAAGGCYEPAPFDQSEAPEEGGAERLRGKRAKTAGHFYFLIVFATLLYLIGGSTQCTALCVSL